MFKIAPIILVLFISVFSINTYAEEQFTQEESAVAQEFLNVGGLIYNSFDLAKLNGHQGFAWAIGIDTNSGKKVLAALENDGQTIIIKIEIAELLKAKENNTFKDVAEKYAKEIYNKLLEKYGKNKV